MWFLQTSERRSVAFILVFLLPWALDSALRHAGGWITPWVLQSRLHLMWLMLCLSGLLLHLLLLRASTMRAWQKWLGAPALLLLWLLCGAGTGGAKCGDLEVQLGRPFAEKPAQLAQHKLSCA